MSLYSGSEQQQHRRAGVDVRHTCSRPFTSVISQAELEPSCGLTRCVCFSSALKSKAPGTTPGCLRARYLLGVDAASPQKPRLPTRLLPKEAAAHAEKHKIRTKDSVLTA